MSAVVAVIDGEPIVMGFTPVVLTNSSETVGTPGFFRLLSEALRDP